MSFLSKLTSSMFTKKQSYSYADQEKDMALVERASKRVAQQQRAYEEQLIIEERLDNMFDNEFPDLSDNERLHVFNILSSQSSVSRILTEDQKNGLIIASAGRRVASQQRAAQAQFVAERQAGTLSDFDEKYGLNDKERGNIHKLFKDAYIKSKE